MSDTRSGSGPQGSGGGSLDAGAGPLGPSAGPLAERDIVTGGPIDDPATADRNNPRWAAGPTGTGIDVVPPQPIPQPPGDLPDPQGDPLSGPDTFATAPVPAALADVATPAGSGGTPQDQAGSGGAAASGGTPQDQAAQILEGELEVGRDNIREGRGDVLPNPALAEGGDHG